MSLNPNASYGRALLDMVKAQVPTFGRVFIVKSSSDSDDPNFTALDNVFKPDSEGIVRVFTSLADAYNAVTTNNNDVILLDAHSAHTLTSMLDVSKSRVHFIGMGGPARRYGQRSRITMGVTTAATDVHMIKNTGVGNTFTNIKFDSGNTLTQHTSAIGEGGEYAIYTNCEFYSSVKLDSDTFSELLLNGDSTQFYGCTFGSLATQVSGDKVRPAVITTAGGVSGGTGVSRDVLFDNCRFWKNAGGTTTAMIKITSDNDLERFMEIKDCVFVANKLGSVPAVAISAPTLTKSQVLMTGYTVSANCTKLATATGVLSGLPARVATATIGIQGT